MTIGLAIVGAGAIGAKHAEAAASAGVRLHSIVDSNLDRAEQLATRHEVSCTDDITAVLRADDVDAVAICVPNVFHKPLAVAAMEAGKHVLLEKPMGTNAAECREINRISKATGRVVQMGFVHRYTAVGKVAKSIVQQQRLGEIYHVTGQIYFRRGVPGLGRWFTNRELSGGGALIDVGVHLLDMAMFLLDFPELIDVRGQVHANFGRHMKDYVYSDMWAGPPDCNGICNVEDSAHAFIRFQNRVSFDLQVAWAGNFPPASLPTTMFGVFGDRGGMTFELFGDHIDLTYQESAKIFDEVVPAPDVNPFRDQLSDFAESIRTGKLLGATGQQGQIVQEIVDEIYASSMPQLEGALC